MPMKTHPIAVARGEIRAWLRATSGQAMRVWLSMPDGWTPATQVAKGLPQSSVSTALAVLLAAGAVDTRRIGHSVLYRPRDSFQVYAKALRRGGA